MYSFFILALIDINDFYSVYDKVKSLSAHWRSIAISLRLRIDTINIIEANSHGNIISCLQKVLEYWLKKDYDYKAHGVPCWRMVCVAVKEGGANPALAQEIAQEHYLPTIGGVSRQTSIIMTQLLILLAICISFCMLPLQ